MVHSEQDPTNVSSSARASVKLKHLFSWSPIDLVDFCFVVYFNIQKDLIRLFKPVNDKKLTAGLKEHSYFNRFSNNWDFKPH